MDARKPFRSPRPTIGLAYSAAVRNFIARHPGEVDHVEIPFELLRHDPAVLEIGEKLPIILHCASLSIAGTARCKGETIQQIKAFARHTRTPWIGEHLAFISANVSEAGPHPEEYAPGEPYNIGYTVSPVMNARTIARVVQALTAYARCFQVPLLIENSPLYFEAPGSTMAQSEFITSICRETGVGLLLDLAHLLITARRADLDPFAELDRLPLNSVVEVHISGVDEQDDGSWDDHAKPAPEIVHRLLDRVLERAAPRAVTLEYNWSSRFPEALLMDELGRVRASCGTCS